MNIVRCRNMLLNDAAHDVIHDIIERGQTKDMPNIGIFETLNALRFNEEPVIAVGIMPEDLFAIAWESEDKQRSQLTFYQRFFEGPQQPRFRRIFRTTIMESTLSLMSLTVATLFFLERNWFHADTVEEETQKAVAWAEKYYPGYENQMQDLLAMIGYQLTAPRIKEGDKAGNLEVAKEFGKFRVE
jgi:hypothetical protein